MIAGWLAHDFNNLLAIMLGQYSIAKAKLRAEHEGREHLDEAIQATETAAWLTRQLLAYTGRGQIEVGTVQLNDLISHRRTYFQEALPPHITLAIHLTDSLPLIRANENQLQHCILNLLFNAAEAIGDQPGSIIISTSTLQLKAGRFAEWEKANEALVAGDFVMLEIADSGEGFDEETLGQMFEPFFSTKENGHGLGLAAVLGIVRGHKGSLRAFSRPEQGATIQLLFPVVEELPVETAVLPSSALKSKVLIIDDERQVRDAITDILDLDNIAVLTAASGEEGIAVFSAHQAQIGLIILDMSMPGISGIEAFKALRKIDRAVKIILSSGYSEAEIMQKMSGARPTGFLQKPYRLDSVLRMVEKYL